MGEYDPTKRNYMYQYGKKLDIDKIRNAINYFLGTHSFKSFTPDIYISEFSQAASSFPPAIRLRAACDESQLLMKILIYYCSIIPEHFISLQK